MMRFLSFTGKVALVVAIAFTAILVWLAWT